MQGTAAGAGFPLAAAGDIVLAADTAKFSLAYTKVGLSPDGGRLAARAHPGTAPHPAPGHPRRPAHRPGGRRRRAGGAGRARRGASPT
nr:enoyl-CoA hydratase-related protein [Nocardioides convexus]